MYISDYHQPRNIKKPDISFEVLHNIIIIDSSQILHDFSFHVPSYFCICSVVPTTFPT